jgi:hypothetical protein
MLGLLERLAAHGVDHAIELSGDADGDVSIFSEAFGKRSHSPAASILYQTVIRTRDFRALPAGHVEFAGSPERRAIPIRTFRKGPPGRTYREDDESTCFPTEAKLDSIVNIALEARTPVELHFVRSAELQHSEAIVLYRSALAFLEAAKGRSRLRCV